MVSHRIIYDAIGPDGSYLGPFASENEAIDRLRLERDNLGRKSGGRVMMVHCKPVSETQVYPEGTEPDDI